MLKEQKKQELRAYQAKFKQFSNKKTSNTRFKTLSISTTAIGRLREKYGIKNHLETIYQYIYK